MLKRLGKSAVIWLPYAWLAVFFLAPFLLVAKLSLSAPAIAMPPYIPAFDFADGIAGWWNDIQKFSIENFVFLTTDSLYWKSYLSSLQIALISTFLTLLIGYPLAYAMARAPRNWRPLLLMLVILPFWTSFLIRVYAWIGILKKEGLLNQFLLWLGIISEPLTIMNTDWAVYIGIVYSYLPFMILPLYANLEKQSPDLLEAAADLGATRVRAFWQVTWPLSMSGVVAGCLLVFIPAVGEFVIPSLLGGSDTLMIGRVLYDEFFSNRDWPVSSAVAIILLLILLIPIMLFQRSEARAREAGT
ncbi:ABC transporter permease [Ahrensia sp. R2A130]|uniref:ABC transporter permease n=1 Tax=Ahrensia sp. R2A130 TaxID=744979 RepID=UPI0001E08C5A|nr:ABC transporter permease subunit [Ahrensia sp. R2A130]EFL88516.1 putrescine transport system permease protein PotH [Ahrensia sp. R2A130]